MNALIVNDEIITTEMLRDNIDWPALSVTGVFTAYSAEEARTVFTEQVIDIYLCDIEMPEEDGIQLIRWVRERQIDSDCILLTCHADFIYAQEAIRLGCSDYQLLPARYEEITRSIAAVLEKRKQRLRNEEYVQYGENWLSEQNRHLEETGKKNTPESISERCKQYIQEHISSPDLSVKGVADALFLNRVYLNRVFRKENNMSISQYIILQRMTLAARLLENPDLTAASIAERVGYKDYSHFTKSFSNFYGCSPTNYHPK